jgi:hypothetical protein
MTREEAIKSLQNIIEYWTYKPTEVEAAKMAIAALRPVSREQVERVRGEWINTNKEVEQMCKCSKCGYPISYFWSRTPFCPNCGAPMTDEAVDMVLKRLEVPKDDQT